MVNKQPEEASGQASQTLAEQGHTHPLPAAYGMVRMGLKAHLGLLGWLAMLVAALLAGFWFVTIYLSNTTAFTQPWFGLFVTLMLICGALCLQPDRIRPRRVTRNLISSIYLLLTFSSLYGAIIFSGRFAPYFAQLYILLTFIALYRFNRRAALLVCAGASLVYVLLTLPWLGVFGPNQLILSLAALWASVAVYLLLYSRQQAAQRQLLEQVKGERRLRRQLETGSRLSAQLNANLNLDELLGEVVGAAAHLIDVPYCSLQICDYANNRLVMRNIYHSDPEQQRKLSEQWANTSFGINQGLAGWVLQTGESVDVERAADDSRYLPMAGRAEVDDWSLLLVPLTIKQRVIGVLSAGSPQRRYFSAEDRNLFSSFASQAAVAIENATMVNELIEGKAQLERSQAGLAAVLDVNRTLLTQRDYIAAMHVIVDNLMPLIPFANCIIYLVGEDDRMLVSVLTAGADMADAEHESFPIGEGITGLVAASGVAEMVNHAELDPRSAVIKGTDEDEPSSLLVAPLLVEGQVRGVIRVGRTGDWLFEPDELELLKIFATQASLALENAHLIERQSQTANDQSWMMSLTEILISALDIEEQLQQVVRASVSLTEADFGALLRDEDGSLKVAAVSAPQDYLKVGQMYVMDATPITEAFHARRETYLPGSLKGEGVAAANSAPLIASRFRSQLAVPLVVGDELLGVLSVFSAQPAAFDRRFLRLLATFANQAAIAIRNSQLFAELEARRRELELKTAALEVSKALAQRNAREQAMLSHISKIAVNASGHSASKEAESEWLAQSLKLVKMGMGVDKATLVTLNKSGQRELVAIVGFSALGEDIVRRRVGDCELHQAVERGKFEEVKDCSTRGGMLGLLYAHEQMSNALAVPLQASDQIIGVLTVYNKEADERSASQVSPNLDYSPDDAMLPFVNGNGRYRTNGSGSGGNGSRNPSTAVPPPTTTTNLSGNGSRAPSPAAFNTDNQILLRNMANAIASGIENARNYKSLSDTYFDSIRMLVDIMEAKDPYTKGHSEKVMVCAMAIGKELIRGGHAEFKPEQMGSLLWAALLHDIGKLGIRDELLHLAARPGVEGFWVLASHTRIGAKILNNIEKLKQLAPLVQAHHERWDGQGYPDGLMRAEIPFISRIITVADSFDAMTSDRDYQKKRSVEWAMEELERNSGSQFDPEIVAVFLHILREQGDPREHAVPEIGPTLAPDWVRI